MIKKDVLFLIMLAVLGTIGIMENNKEIYIESVVLGRSMEPTIYAGEFIKMQAIERESELETGDIIIYQMIDEDGIKRKILHRIIFIDKDEKGWFAYAKGDNPSVAVDNWHQECYDNPSEECAKKYAYKIRFSQIEGRLYGDN